MNKEDTIAAIATPLGNGGLAVVRMSGPDAFRIADACFNAVGARSAQPSRAESHTLHYGRIHDGGKAVDEVMLAVMRGPRTFTREDVVEISCHGGSLPARLVLDALLRAGARAAAPGEFTKRAFLNGRLDLAQAEAVADIIHAQTELALRAANEQLAGGLSQKTRAASEDLLNALAHIEAHIDFPEEDIAPDSRQELCRRIGTALGFIADLLATADEGRVLRGGIRAVIVGRPNAGKSSLLNRLLGHERAIVSPHPGTTRDTIEEVANIRGIPIVFVDTAGMRSAGDTVEEQGIRRAREALQSAELVLLVIDRSKPCLPFEPELISKVQEKKCVTVYNKADLPDAGDPPCELPEPRVLVSCATGTGIEDLKEAIAEKVWSGAQAPAGFASTSLRATINARHQDALQRARAAAERTRDALDNGLSLELVAMDLRIALSALGEITGETTTEDLLDRIFSQFCIGK